MLDVVQAVLASFEAPCAPQALQHQDAGIELARDLFEERAAIREHLGGEPAPRPSAPPCTAPLRLLASASLRFAERFVRRLGDFRR